MAMDNLSDDALLESLIKEFAPPVEQSIVQLLFQELGYHKGHEALSELAKHARDEEESGFDPTAGQGFSSSEQDSGEDALLSPLSALSVANEAATSIDSWTTTSTTTNDEDAMISGALEGEGKEGNEETKEAPHEVTMASLKEAFPTLNERDIQRALQESGGDHYNMTGLLLNIGHLEETGQRPKGIDAFVQTDDRVLGPMHSKARKRAARKAAAKKAAALQDALNSSSSRPQPLPVDYKLAPSALDEEEEQTTTATVATVATSTTLTTTRTTGNHVEMQENAQRYRDAAGAAFTSASAAWRRGRSDPLFRQAAVVYADRGHAQAALARVSQSIAADFQVDEQSDANTVDVHYIGVADGVRIALERTRQWWARLESFNNSNTTSRVRAARENPLTIITGSGVHSAKGVSRMYKEVGEALRRENWIVEPGTGHYHVKGKKRM